MNSIITTRTPVRYVILIAFFSHHLACYLLYFSPYCWISKLIRFFKKVNLLAISCIFILCLIFLRITIIVYCLSQGGMAGMMPIIANPMLARIPDLSKQQRPILPKPFHPAMDHNSSIREGRNGPILDVKTIIADYRYDNIYNYRYSTGPKSL